jgi:hypothetical protein
VTVIFQYRPTLIGNKMFTKEKIKPENSLLQPHKESTLEKQQRERLERRAAIANKLKDLDKEVK